MSQQDIPDDALVHQEISRITGQLPWIVNPVSKEHDDKCIVIREQDEEPEKDR